MVRVRDLKDQTGVPGPRPILLCDVCGMECSANAGDYWNVEPERVFRHDGRPLCLVTKHTVYRRAKLTP